LYVALHYRHLVMVNVHCKGKWKLACYSRNNGSGNLLVIVEIMEVAT
jgi:hypothetical protein